MVGVSKKESEDIKQKAGEDKMVVEEKSMTIRERNRGRFECVLADQPTVDANKEKIIELHEKITEYQKLSLDSAIEAGRLLFEAKERIKHGLFGQWIYENLPFCDRTAQNYMKLYKYREVLKKEKVSSLTDAYFSLKGEAMPTEIIDATDNINIKSKWEIVDAFIKEEALPTRSAKGMISNLTIDKETLTRLKNEEFPFKNTKGQYVKIIVNFPNTKYVNDSQVAEFIYEAQKLLKPGGKLIFHKHKW